MLPLFALIGCIERVTDVAVPLDPAFYEGGGGADNPSGAASALGIPWNGTPGEKVDVVFAIASPTEGAIQFDVVVPDAAAPGGVKRIGRVESQELTVTLSVPKTVPTFTIEVFQDPGSDGPSDDDPYATQSVDVAAALAAGAPIAVTLVLGARPAPSEAGPGGGGGVAEPWAGATGEVVTFTAEILTDDEGEIQVDFAEFDPTAPGGQKRVGQVRLPGTGAFTVDVPKTVEKFRIEAFQDREGDGPTTDDPYAELTTVVASISAEPVRLQLVAGSRGAAGSGGAGPGPGDPGPGGGGPGGGAPGGGPGGAPWESYEGARVEFTATIVAPALGEVQIDVNEPDASAPGGQKRVGQLRLMGSAPFAFKVPADFVSFRIEAFQDPDHDGPSPTDPFAELTVTPATVANNPTLTLAVGSRGQPTAPAPQPGGEVPTGPTVKVSGKVGLPGKAKVKVDIFKPAIAAGKGRDHVKTVDAVGGKWEALLTPGLGTVEVEAYEDLTSNGPSPDDPKAYAASTVVVGTEPLTGVDLSPR
ncbi:hypothetical protein LBMAG42_47640 [Deltaproteobacteria bacterium]|nr:hypothetical protein LBMAG42_47640 [Deltaproteobacteria bacterium]